ncbi:MAG: hypothetical protein H6636_06960 [Anaerolineales bacterium]|nr:hypothetical protein [Anaerolineales bacterium]
MRDFERQVDDILDTLLNRSLNLEKQVEELERSDGPGARHVYVSTVTDYTTAAEIDAAFLAEAGLPARDGDLLLYHKQSNDHLQVLKRETGEWHGIDIPAAPVSYS